MLDRGGRLVKKQPNGGGKGGKKIISALTKHLGPVGRHKGGKYPLDRKCRGKTQLFSKGGVQAGKQKAIKENRKKDLRHLGSVRASKQTEMFTGNGGFHTVGWEKLGENPTVHTGKSKNFQSGGCKK